MNTSELNIITLNCHRLNQSQLNTVGILGAGHASPQPEPTDSAWLWNDGTDVLWGNGDKVLTEQTE